MSGLSAAAAGCVDRLFDRRDQLNIPGAALAVTDGAGLLYQQSYGSADLAAGTPVTADTLFEIGSISKSLTALLALQDAASGDLDLHVPVQRYLPWFSVRAQHSQPITIHHLLGHTGGIVEGTDASTEARAEVWSLRDTPAVATPGTWFHYSNTGYKAVGLVLEELHDQSYGDLLRSRVLGPLGLEDTEPTITGALRSRLAVGHNPLRDDRPLPPGGQLAPATWIDTATADGSIATTAADLAAYLRAYMVTGPVLTEQIVTAMTRAPTPTGGLDVPGSTYGYGWFVVTLDGHRCLAHSGGMVGYSCYLIADLAAQLGVALLTNGPSDPGELARCVLRTARADQEGRGLPPPPAQLLDPAIVPEARELAGVYSSPHQELRLRADGDRLMTDRGCPVVHAGANTLHVLDDEFARFALGVEREGTKIVAMTYGPATLIPVGDRDGRPREAEPRADPLAGHWRAHNPWCTNFRTFSRDGQLLFAIPGRDEQPLIKLPDGDYRIGADHRLPERLSFSMVLNGRPHQAALSGAPYHRTFTP